VALATGPVIPGALSDKRYSCDKRYFVSFVIRLAVVVTRLATSGAEQLQHWCTWGRQ